MPLPSLTELEQKFTDISRLKYLASGGQKTVLSGNHSTYGSIVLKLTNKLDKRTEREISIVTTNIFPGVPILHDWGVENFNGDDVWYLIEEQIHGKTLRSALMDNGTLDFDTASALLDFLLRSAARFEKERLIHRDIKPENIIVGDDGNFYILDFGIARALDLDSLTATVAPIGPATLGYAAPEQFRNMKKELDSRADLFSIGVVFHECVTGKNPFVDGASGHLDILKRSESLEIPSLNLPNDPLSELSGFIDTLVQKWPSRRPRSAAEALYWFSGIINSA